MGVANLGGQDEIAGALAQRLRLPLLVALPEAGDARLCILCDDGGPGLQLLGKGRPGPVRVTFDDPALRHRRRGGHNELLGRAIGWRSERAPTVLDATAGYGRDAFVLADLGCEVHLCERQPVMAILLEFAIARARAGEDSWQRSVAGRLHLHAMDARRIPGGTLGKVDVIYLDPMFPDARRAMPGKEMQVLSALLDDETAVAESGTGGSDAAEDSLLAWACRQSVRRVVVKRPKRAPPLAGRRPSHELSGRSVRFDVYALAGAAGIRSEAPTGGNSCSSEERR